MRRTTTSSSPPAVEGVLSSSAGLTAQIREIGVALPPLAPTTENQFELGASAPLGLLRVAATGYYRATDNPVHTTVWPDSRIYSYASFDRERAYGLEAKAELPALTRYGVTGYLNYALGRVNFYNPVTGGFVTEAEHLTDTNRFLAPMDQTHTLTAGATYRHTANGRLDRHDDGVRQRHADRPRRSSARTRRGRSRSRGRRVGRRQPPGAGVTLPANLSLGLDLLRGNRQRSRLSFSSTSRTSPTISTWLPRRASFRRRNTRSRG